MAGENALVRTLPAVEALGAVDVVCTDKTGTLTEGEMRVRAAWVYDAVVDINSDGTAAIANGHGETDESLAVDGVEGRLKRLLEIGAVFELLSALKDGDSSVRNPACMIPPAVNLRVR